MKTETLHKISSFVTGVSLTVLLVFFGDYKQEAFKPASDSATSFMRERILQGDSRCCVPVGSVRQMTQQEYNKGWEQIHRTQPELVKPEWPGE